MSCLPIHMRMGSNPDTRPCGLDRALLVQATSSPPRSSIAIDTPEPTVCQYPSSRARYVAPNSPTHQLINSQTLCALRITSRLAKASVSDSASETILVSRAVSAFVSESGLPRVSSRIPLPPDLPGSRQSPASRPWIGRHQPSSLPPRSLSRPSPAQAPAIVFELASAQTSSCGYSWREAKTGTGDRPHRRWQRRCGTRCLVRELPNGCVSSKGTGDHLQIIS
jgi:hypothetical protein